MKDSFTRPPTQWENLPPAKQVAWNELYAAYLASIDDVPGWADRWHDALAKLGQP